MILQRKLCITTLSALMILAVPVTTVSAETVLTGFTAEKVGEYYTDSLTQLSVYGGGTIHRKDGLYGILSPDGTSDTGAIYVQCTAKKNYFMVLSADSQPEDVNYYGLVDGYGNTILPEEYALIDVISDRFAQVYTATEQTDSEDEALLYSYEITDGFNFKQITPEEGDTLYKGYWRIYDIENGSFVDEIQSEDPMQLETMGAFLKARGYYNGYYVSPDGVILYDTTSLDSPIDDVFSDGSYSVETENGFEVYSANGTLCFTNQEEEIEKFSRREGDYYVAQFHQDDKYYEALYNQSGERVTSLYSGTNVLQVFGDVMIAKEEDNKYLCALDGSRLLDFPITRIIISNEEIPNWRLSVAALYAEDSFTLIDKSGNILFSGDAASADNYDSYGVPFIKQDDTWTYYCYQDQDFTISGKYFLFDGIAQRENEDGTVALIDCITGETLVDGYTRYRTSNEYYFGSNDTLIVCAERPEKDGHDIFTIR